jgi:hypothetical protein
MKMTSTPIQKRPTLELTPACLIRANSAAPDAHKSAQDYVQPLAKASGASGGYRDWESRSRGNLFAAWELHLPALQKNANCWTSVSKGRERDVDVPRVYLNCNNLLLPCQCIRADRPSGPKTYTKVASRQRTKNAVRPKRGSVLHPRRSASSSTPLAVNSNHPPGILKSRE